MDDGNDPNELRVGEAQRGPGFGLWWNGCIVPILKGVAYGLGIIIILIYVGRELGGR
jgi:hypothetical protein